MAYVPGIDVSHWDGKIDWMRVRAAGQRYMFAKATEGDYYQDDTYQPNWEGAKAAKILRGAYHFYKPEIDPVVQAKYFTDFIARFETGEFPPVLDMEVTVKKVMGANVQVPRLEYIDAIRAFLKAVEQTTGKKPFIYANWDILNNYFVGSNFQPPSWMFDYVLWLAQYPNAGSTATAPLMPKNYTRWHFWQWTEHGRVDGIDPNTDVDLNWFNGTVSDLYKLAGLPVLADDGGSAGGTPISSGGSGQPSASQPGGGQPGGIGTPATRTTATTYITKAGDTLESISARFGIELAALLKANPVLLKSGTALTIPARQGGTPVASGGQGSTPTPPPPPPPTTVSYVVKSGDTLIAIAARHGVSADAIARANNITNPNLISVGQTLQIPKA